MSIALPSETGLKDDEDLQIEDGSVSLTKLEASLLMSEYYQLTGTKPQCTDEEALRPVCEPNAGTDRWPGGCREEEDGPQAQGKHRTFTLVHFTLTLPPFSPGIHRTLT
jgi:hypothetical protein